MVSAGLQWSVEVVCSGLCWSAVDLSSRWWFLVVSGDLYRSPPVSTGVQCSPVGSRTLCSSLLVCSTSSPFQSSYHIFRFLCLCFLHLFSFPLNFTTTPTTQTTAPCCTKNLSMHTCTCTQIYSLTLHKFTHTQHMHTHVTLHTHTFALPHLHTHTCTPHTYTFMYTAYIQIHAHLTHTLLPHIAPYSCITMPPCSPTFYHLPS